MTRTSWRHVALLGIILGVGLVTFLLSYARVTPATSYPAAGWTLVGQSGVPIPIGERNLYVQKAVLTKDRDRRIALYWYLWSDFDRDPEMGVSTVRLHIPVTTTDEDALEAGADFIRSLFPQVVPWHRF